MANTRKVLTGDSETERVNKVAAKNIETPDSLIAYVPKRISGKKRYNFFQITCWRNWVISSSPLKKDFPWGKRVFFFSKSGKSPFIDLVYLYYCRRRQDWADRVSGKIVISAPT